MFYKFVYYIFKLFPKIKQFFWKKWYTIFAKKVLDKDLRFMNYGYHCSNFNINLDLDDENDRYTIQLYHHVATQINLKNLNVLEIGSGRGGGASYIARYLKPKKITGIDLSPTAIEFCNTIYSIENLNFIQGNAENLPFKKDKFDVVINVESSHCYQSMNKFVNEVSRVLKPEGYFLFCDLRRDIYIKELLDQINSNGLSILTYANISDNIISATEKMSDERELSINKLNIGLLKNIVKSFAAIKGSNVHQSFKKGYLQYISAICKNVK